RRPCRIREDRRADGVGAPHREAAAPDQPAREPGAVPARDTVQSRLPDPEWLERWLDEQIRFDGEWEKKVVERILHNLSILFERTFATAQELNRYRREVTARVNGAADGP
ncbi:hypothetical protein M3665_24320, partial [Bacillus licheniformis]|nr:hypothetical protein [Bacillus licheniformis]